MNLRDLLGTAKDVGGLLFNIFGEGDEGGEAAEILKKEFAERQRLRNIIMNPQSSPDYQRLVGERQKQIPVFLKNVLREVNRSRLTNRRSDRHDQLLSQLAKIQRRDIPGTVSDILGNRARAALGAQMQAPVLADHITKQNLAGSKRLANIINASFKLAGGLGEYAGVIPKEKKSSATKIIR